MSEDTYFNHPKYPYGIFRLGAQWFAYVRPLPNDEDAWDSEPVQPIENPFPEEADVDLSTQPMYNFVNVQKQHAKYPNVFDAPPCAASLAAIEPGSIVKVCHNGERFWVIVKKRQDNLIGGLVDNALVIQQPFKDGDMIVFRPEHVFIIHGKRQ